MEPEDLLLGLRESATGPYPEQNAFSPQLSTLFP
jgi:hypothetical protein